MQMINNYQRGIEEEERGIEEEKKEVCPDSKSFSPANLAKRNENLPTLLQADDWYNNEILPKRKVAGLNWHIIKNIHEKSNISDSEGKCGDAAMYVREEYFRKFDSYYTNSGDFLGRILWVKSTILNNLPYINETGFNPNHAATVMLKEDRAHDQSYEWDEKGNFITKTSKIKEYNTNELLSLHVYDLFYKKEAMTLDEWWKSCDSRKDGRIYVGMYA